MNDIYSFYQLISKYQIEIPVIQRDYAQGRMDAQAIDVRKSMVQSIVETVTASDKNLFFDFVYGRIDKDKFIPFDGQQRLTTLFLFHKYVFEKCYTVSNCKYKDKCICKDRLTRFSYHTRQSSREFCEQLILHDIIPTDNSPVYSFITNQSWFYPDWEKDPTINGMLRMLDEIHLKLKDIPDIQNIAQKLTSGCTCPLTFHFVDMAEHKLSDETYVKMNARGKTLTGFENFKASLEQYLEEKNAKILSCFKGEYDKSLRKYTGIDGTWIDLFWDVENKGKTKLSPKTIPDALMMSFFNRHFMNVWKCWYETRKKAFEKLPNPKEDEIDRKQKEYDSMSDRIEEELILIPTNEDFTSWEIYEYILDNCGLEACLNPIFNSWNELCKENNTIENDCQPVWLRDVENQWDLFRGTINNHRETYPSRVAFYALLKYFEKQEYNAVDFKQWMRVVWNIVENSTIDSLTTYNAALQLMEEMAQGSHNIYVWLAKSGKTISSNHASEQVTEEREKAKHILNPNGIGLCRYNGLLLHSANTTWEDIIIEAEKHAFFKGAVRFLFRDKNGNCDWNMFDKTMESAMLFFKVDGIAIERLRDFIQFLSAAKLKQVPYSTTAATWKRILLDNNLLQEVFDFLVRQNNSIPLSDLHNDLLSILPQLPLHNSTWHFVDNWDGISNVLTVYARKEKTPRCLEQIYCLDNNRNGILSYYYGGKLYTSPKQTTKIYTDRKNAHCGYFYGLDIRFQFNSRNFEWNRDGKIYLLDAANLRQKDSNENDIAVAATNINQSNFIDQLDELIKKIPDPNAVAPTTCERKDLGGGE